MQLISKYNKGFGFFLFVINIFRKYAWFVPLKDRKCVAITNALQKILGQPIRKPSIIWVNRGSEFYNRSMKSCFNNSQIEIHLTHNDGKSVVAEKLYQNLKEQNFKIEYLTSKSKNMYKDKVDDAVNEYSNTYYTATKMKPIDVASNTYINFGVKK